MAHSIRRHPFVWLYAWGWVVTLAPVFIAMDYHRRNGHVPGLLAELLFGQYATVNQVFTWLAPLVTAMAAFLSFVGALWLAVDSEDWIAGLFARRNNRPMDETAETTASHNSPPESTDAELTRPS